MNRMTHCKIEIIEGHVVGCFTKDGSSTPYLPTGIKAAGIYLYETLCGTFAAVTIRMQIDLVTGGKVAQSRSEDAMFLFEAGKIRILPG